MTKKKTAGSIEQSGTATEAETIEPALDLVVFRAEVAAGLVWLAGSGAIREVLTG